MDKVDDPLSNAYYDFRIHKKICHKRVKIGKNAYFEDSILMISEAIDLMSANSGCSFPMFSTASPNAKV